MKKVWLKTTALLFTISVVSSSSIAANPSVPSPIAPIHPKLVITAIERVEQTDKSGKKSLASKPLNANKVSRSAKNQELCWIAFDAQFAPMVNVVEVFKSPDAMSFEGSHLSVTTSIDKKLHTLVSQKRSVEKGLLVESCFRFDSADPVGEYTLTVEIDNIKFAPVKFEVIK